MTAEELIEQMRTNVHALSAAIGAQIKPLKAKLGTVSLTTTAQDVSGAINELRAGQAAAAGINDATPSTTATYSSSKIDALLLANLNPVDQGNPNTNFSAAFTAALA